jgi:hypothetical protein
VRGGRVNVILHIQRGRLDVRVGVEPGAQATEQTAVAAAP